MEYIKIDKTSWTLDIYTVRSLADEFIINVFCYIFSKTQHESKKRNTAKTQISRQGNT